MYAASDTVTVSDVTNADDTSVDDVTDSETLTASVRECFKRNVIIGYSDVGAVGCRALLGLDMRKEYFSLPVRDLHDKLNPLCVRRDAPPATEQHFAPLQVLNCKYEQFSMVIVNSELTSSQHHVVATCIADICLKCNTEKVLVLSSLRLDVQPCEEMYENVYNATPITGCPPLLWDTEVRDPFLSTLSQCLQISGIAWNLIIVQGHRNQSSHPDRRTAKQIEAFQNVISQHSRIKFDLDLSLSLILRSEKDAGRHQVTSVYN